MGKAGTPHAVVPLSLRRSRRVDPACAWDAMPPNSTSPPPSNFPRFPLPGEREKFGEEFRAGFLAPARLHPGVLAVQSSTQLYKSW